MLQVSQISPHSLSLSWAELWPRLPRFLWWWWLCRWQWWWWKITPLPTIILRSYCWLSQSKFKGPIAKLWIWIQWLVRNFGMNKMKVVLNIVLTSWTSFCPPQGVCDQRIRDCQRWVKLEKQSLLCGEIFWDWIMWRHQYLWLLRNSFKSCFLYATPISPADKEKFKIEICGLFLTS